MGPITMIMRDYTYEQVRVVAEILCDSKYVTNIEVTMNTNNVLSIIEKISEEFSDRLAVGAGTVVTFDQLKKAISVGAKFVLSPTMFTQEMIQYCKDHDVIAIPGAFSPSEIHRMHTLGAPIIKVFPSQEVSKNYAFKIKEPLDDVKLMAVGGVNVNNVDEYFNGGYDAVGTAGGIFSKEDIVSMNKKNLKESLDAFELVLETCLS